MYVPEWCNGSTIDFDSISIGSIPVSGAKQKYTQRLAQADVADYSFWFQRLTGSTPVEYLSVW